AVLGDAAIWIEAIGKLVFLNCLVVEPAFHQRITEMVMNNGTGWVGHSYLAKHYHRVAVVPGIVIAQAGLQGIAGTTALHSAPEQQCHACDHDQSLTLHDFAPWGVSTCSACLDRFWAIG